MDIIKEYIGDYRAGDNAITLYACFTPYDTPSPRYHFEFCRNGRRISGECQGFWTKEQANEEFKRLKAEYNLRLVKVDAVAEANIIISRCSPEWVKEKTNEAKEYYKSNTTDAKIKAYMLHEIADNIVLCAHMNDAYNADFDSLVLPAFYAEFIGRELIKQEENKSKK